MMHSVLKDYYERDADRFWDPRIGLSGRDLAVYRLLDGLNGKVLEYGCGSGSLLLGLARESRFEQCYGVDISEKALGRIQNAWKDFAENRESDGKLKLVLPSNDTLPQIPSNTFDVVISVATIEHVLDPYVVLDELHRIAKPDGVLISSVPNYAYLKHRIHLLFGIQPRTGTDEPVENWRKEGWDGMHLHTFTKKSFQVLLHDCGWEPQKWLGCGTRFNSIGLGVLRRNFPGLWSGEIIAICRKRPQ